MNLTDPTSIVKVAVASYTVLMKRRDPASTGVLEHRAESSQSA